MLTGLVPNSQGLKSYGHPEFCMRMVLLDLLSYG